MIKITLYFSEKLGDTANFRYPALWKCERLITVLVDASEWLHIGILTLLSGYIYTQKERRICHLCCAYDGVHSV